MLCEPLANGRDFIIGQWFVKVGFFPSWGVLFLFLVFFFLADMNSCFLKRIKAWCLPLLFFNDYFCSLSIFVGRKHHFFYLRWCCKLISFQMKTLYMLTLPSLFDLVWTLIQIYNIFYAHFFWAEETFDHEFLLFLLNGRNYLKIKENHFW